MSDTRRTLLQRVRDPADGAAWAEFFGLYAPLVEGYARAHGLTHADVEEVRDQCLAVLAQKLPAFEYSREKGSFQAWLHRLARAKVVDLLRRRRVRAAEDVELGTLADAAAEPDAAWEREWRAEHLRYALRSVQESEPPERFRVLELLLLEELSVAEVCARTGLNADQVYKRKAALLKRVREVLERLGTD